MAESVHDSVMHRELGDERKRYGRRSLREQLDDAIAWPGSHRFATGIILVVIAGALLLSATRGRFADPRELAVGDCLYVRTAAVPDDTRPIGDARSAGEAVLVGSAETASCSASHGHEVSAVIDLTPLHYQSAEAQAACTQAFEPYVGHASESSRYLTFAAVPSADQLASGATTAICLVARADGQWMDHPARGSGE